MPKANELLEKQPAAQDPWKAKAAKTGGCWVSFYLAQCADILSSTQFKFDSCAGIWHITGMAKTNDQNRVTIKVFLYGIQPQIWRRFSISNQVTFIALSDAIQAAMGWDNKHPHEFRHGKGKRLVDVIGPVGLQDQTLGEFQDEAELTVAEFLGKRKLPLRILYRYDFADEWIHEIVFEKRCGGEGGPEMLDGARACPQEDCGGTFQYMQALHGEIGWMNPGYEPEAFDLKAISFEPKKSRRAR